MSFPNSIIFRNQTEGEFNFFVQCRPKAKAVILILNFYSQSDGLNDWNQLNEKDGNKSKFWNFGWGWFWVVFRYVFRQTEGNLDTYKTFSSWKFKLTKFRREKIENLIFYNNLF